MIDKNVLKSELAVYGIRVSEQNMFSYFREGTEKSSSIKELFSDLKSDIKKNRLILKSLWDELLGALTLVPSSLIEGSIATQRMFIHSIKQVFKLTSEHKELKEAIPLLKKILTSDIKFFSEKYMSKVVEYTLCMNWVYRAVRYDDFRCFLLEQYSAPDKTAMLEEEENFGNPGSTGHINLHMKDRVIPWVNEEQELKDTESSPTVQGWHRRYFENRDQDWEEGFRTEDTMYRLRNNPYLYGDIDENPYSDTNYRERHRAI